MSLFRLSRIRSWKYTAPRRDTLFTMKNVLELPKQWKELSKITENPVWAELDDDFLESYIDAIASFCEKNTLSALCSF